MKIKGHTVGTPPPLNQKADYDAVFGYNLFNGGATRTENGITITATSLSASGTWDNLATTTTLAQFCPRAVVGRKYVITYGTLTDIMGNKMPIGVMEGGVIKWLPSGTEFVFTEEVAWSGLYLFMGDMGGGYGEFYASYIMVSEEEREYEPSVTLGKSLAVGKLDKVNGGYRLYATNGSGEQTTYGFSAELTKMSLPMRKNKGEIETGTATAPNDAVPLAQMNEALAEKDVEIGILKKRVVNLEQGITPDPYLTDDSTAYVKTVPADALPYARLEAVGGMTHKIITELPIDPVYNLFADEGNNGAVTDATIQEMFPGAVVGKTYTIVYDAGEEGGSLNPVDANDIYELGNPFTLVEGARLRCYAYAYNGDMHTVFSNVRLVEPAVLRETKVTAIESVGKNLYNGGFGGNDCATEENGVLTMVKVTDLKRSSAVWYPPFPLSEICFAGNVLENNVTKEGTALVRYDNNAITYLSVVPAGSTGFWSANAKARSDGAKIVSVQFYFQVEEAVGASFKLTDIIIQPFANPADKTFSPYRKHTFPIPAEVQALPGYGWGVPDGAHNGIEFDDEGKAVYVKRVERKVYNGTEDWRGGGSGDGFYITCYESTGAKKEAKGLSNKMAWRTPYPCVYTSNLDHRYMSIRPKQYATTDVEWKALLAAWQAEGDPLTVYYELETPIVTDVSAYFSRDNFIPVEGGGIIIAQNENGDAAPTAIKYQLKEG